VIDCEFVCTSAKTTSFSVDFTACTDSTFIIDAFPTIIESILDEQTPLFNGDTTSINESIQQLILSTITDPVPIIAEDENISYFGSVDGVDYSGMTAMGFSAETNVFDVPNLVFTANTLSDTTNDPWFYSLFDPTGNGNYTGFSFWTIVQNLTLLNPISTSTTSTSTTSTTTNPCVTPVPTTTTSTTQAPIIECYSGTIIGKIYYYTGNTFTDYDDVVVATLRSRGIANYTDSNVPTYEVTGLTNVSLDMTGPYSGVTKDPYSTFLVNVTNTSGSLFSFF